MLEIKSAPNHASKLRKWYLDSWIFIYAALALSFLSLVCVFILLGYYNNRPLSEWKYFFGINTVLSLLATVMKGSTILATATALSQSKWTWYHQSSQSLQDLRIFDDASRGPLGAAQLLVRLRAWHLASTGAVVTLLALFSDTFVQASATFSSRSRAFGEAWIPISTDYTLSNFHPPAVTGYDLVDQSIKSAVYSAVVDNSTQSSSNVLTPKCSSGSCAFPPYISLGVCSSCFDMTSRLRREPMPSVEGQESFFILHLRTETGTDLDFFSTLNVSSYINMTSVPGQLAASDILARNATLSPNEGLVLSETIVITTSGMTYDAIYRAFQCTLFLCVRAYNGRVQDGKFVENITDIISTGWNITAPEADSSSSTTSLSHTLPNGQSARVSLDYDDVVWLSFYLGAAANVSASASWTSPGPFTGSGSNVNDDSLGLVRALWTNDVVQSIWMDNPVNLAPTWERIADSMTINMRVKSGNRAVGTAHAPEQYIHVRWGFMLLPAAMVLLAALFVVLTSWRSGVCDLPKWGSNNLADVMYAGAFRLEDAVTNEKISIRERPNTALLVSELEKWSEGKMARLRFRAKEKSWLDLE